MDLLHKIILPLLALIVGVVGTAWWSSQTLTVQELAVALQIRGAPNAEREAREWADQTVAAYVKRQQSRPVTAASPPSALAGITGFSPEDAKDICIVKTDVDMPARGPFYIDEQGDKLVGQDARLVLAHVIVDYRKLARQYDRLTKILGITCGFLNKR